MGLPAGKAAITSGLGSCNLAALSAPTRPLGMWSASRPRIQLALLRICRYSFSEGGVPSGDDQPSPSYRRVRSAVLRFAGGDRRTAPQREKRVLAISPKVLSTVCATFILLAPCFWS